MRYFITLAVCLCFGIAQAGSLIGSGIVGGSAPDTVQFGTTLDQTCSSYSDTPSFVNRFQTIANIGIAHIGTNAEIHYLTVYIGPASEGTLTYVGLYDDNGGNPGVQLTHGSMVAASGGWHHVEVTGYTTLAGVIYHIVYGRGSGNQLDTGNDLWTGVNLSNQNFANNNLPTDNNTNWLSSSDGGLMGAFACGN